MVKFNEKKKYIRNSGQPIEIWMHIENDCDRKRSTNTKTFLKQNTLKSNTIE